MTWITAFVACDGGEDRPPPPDPSYEVIALPEAPDDPVVISASEDGRWESAAEPVVLAEDGAAVALEEREWGWVARGGFAPGTYVVSELVGFAIEPHASFVIPPYGAAQVDPAALVGRAWVVADLATSSGLGDLALGQATAVLRVDAADEASVEFVVVVRTDGADCVALRDRAAYDPATATITWGIDRATSTTTLPDGTPIAVDTWDTTARLAFTPAADTAWAHVITTVDTEDLGHLLDDDPDPESVCALLGAFGAACAPCPDDPDGLATCRTEDARRVVLEATDPPADELPMCGVDRLDPPLDGFDLSCDGDVEIDLDLDCGCRTAGAHLAAPGVLVLAVVLRRRRRLG